MEELRLKQVKTFSEDILDRVSALRLQIEQEEELDKEEVNLLALDLKITTKN